MQDQNDKKYPAFKYESQFEHFLWRSRLLVLFAVVPSLFGALVLFLVGTADIIGVVIAVGKYYLLGIGNNIHDSVVPKMRRDLLVRIPFVKLFLATNSGNIHIDISKSFNRPFKLLPSVTQRVA